ncbi:MAG: (deoxy)nucleoside triphosphate pyrophosphohydrolase [Paracoccaceae bacterium]|nr:(deoxy)nucleoside triphosphate pyrophosphohydrolase [Paracoccaceae bacterium]MDE2917078.1 (deoxy)nucleoside triphosphate pyrophosphohydrolase [Paracoccaceae bacterium]
MSIGLASVVALVDTDGRILLARRPDDKSFGGLWEFPGGKVEPDETPENAALRELKEELRIDTWSNCLAPLTFASHEYDGFNQILLLFVCRKWHGIPFPMEGNELKWVHPRDLSKYPMPPANKGMMAILRDWL